jgi:hypothetical protein
MNVGRVELTDTEGGICFFSEFNEEEGWVYNCWMGSISDEIVQNGAMISFDLIKKYDSHSILNDNRQLSGNWSGSNDWIENEYMPSAVAVGLKYIAHVFSPKFITKFSAVDLGTRDLPLIFRNFVDFEEAQQWLRERKISLDK